MTETWLAVSGYEGYYEVSNLGQVRSLSRVVPSTASGGRRTIHPRILKPRLDRDGYPVVTLTKRSIYKLVPVHRIVALAFHGPCPEGHEAAHLDGSRTNCRADNLAWATKRENEHHKYLHGTRASPVGNRCAQMTQPSPPRTLKQ